MPARRDIYLLSPKHLSPETIAVAFAKTSRSPESFREIAAQLTDEKSAEFHEKWVVGYGHSSVAEHAVLHLAVENVSRLAIECLESNRLASYTEKSTRYQRWGLDSFYTPRAVAESRRAALYRQTCVRLFETYLRSLEPVKQLMQASYPRKEGESEARWDGRIRAKYVDNCRFLLPASALRRLGVQEQLQVDAVDLALSRIALEARLDPVERPALAFGVQPNREDGSGAECRQHCLNRRRARVLPALVHGLVDQQPVRADARFGLQIAEPGHLDRSCHVFPLC